MPRRKGSKALLLEYVLANKGRVLSSQELQRASGGVAEWARRLRELRDEEGYQILSHRDRADLKPGEYILLTEERLPVTPRGISKETRGWVLERDGYTCQMCGLAAGDSDPFAPRRTVRLTMGHIVDKSLGGDDTPDNLRAVCSNCNEGLSATAPPKPSQIELMRQLRRATIADQRHALAWLRQKFGE